MSAPMRIPIMACLAALVLCYSAWSEEWGQAIQISEPFDCWRVVTCGQDNTGRIWGLCMGQPTAPVVLPDGDMVPPDPLPRECTWLATFEEEAWHLVTFGDRTELGLMSGAPFVRGPSGSVLFKSLQGQWVQMLGLRGRYIPPQPAPLGQVGVYLDANHAAWVVAGNPGAFLVSKGPPSQPILSFPRGSTVGDAVLFEQRSSVLPIARCPVDGWGRIWLLVKTLSPAARAAGVRSLLLFDPQPHPLPPKPPSLDGQPLDVAIVDGTGIRYSSDDSAENSTKSEPYGAIDYQDENAMAAFFAGTGLWSIDIATLQGKRFAYDADPPKKILGAITSHGTWFAVASDSLWRFRDRVWRKIVFPPDGPQLTQDDAMSIWAGKVGKATWITAGTSSCLWHVSPGDERALPVDWRCGFPYLGVTSVLVLPNDKALLVNTGGKNRVTMSYAELEALATKPHVMEPVDLATRFVQDNVYRLYALRSADAPALSRWDGATWKDYALPPAVGSDAMRQLALDSAWRVWVLPEDANAPCPVFDTGSESWQPLESFGQALQQSEAQNIHWLKCTRPERMPVQGPNGQRAYYTPKHVYAFREGNWRGWTIRTDIEPEGNVFDRPCFYSEEGRLRVGTWKETWECDEAGAWHAVPFAPGPGSWKETATPIPEETLACSGYNRVKTRVLPDRLGRTWSLESLRLFRSGYGLCANVFGEAWFDVFSSFPAMDGALIDPAGNCFLQYEQQGEHYLRVSLPETPPETVLTNQTVLGNGVTLTLNAPGDKSFFATRIDDQPWEKAGSEPVLEIKNLSVGKHCVEVTVVTDNLVADATPTVVYVDVSAAQEPDGPQIDQWITELRSKDYEQRKAAIDRLSRFPEAALESLHRAQKAATDDDMRWWIETAIQGVAEAHKQGNQPSEGNVAPSRP